MITYAQNFEDVMLARVFKGQKTGFYIDIGAWDAETDSITKYFYDQGWYGINIEPAGKCFERICDHRQRDINLNVAVGETSGKQVFYNFEPLGISTLDRGLADSFIARGYQYQEKTIEVATLADLCAQYAPDVIDFLKIDVEGAESEVLHGADWSRYRPRVLVIEAVKPFTLESQWEEWEPFLLQQDYSFVYFDCINRFYIRNEEKPLSRHFDLPPNHLDEFQTRAHFVLQGENGRLQEVINEMQEHNKSLLEQNNSRQADVEYLSSEVGAWSRRAQEAENQLGAVLGSRSFRVGHTIWRLARPVLPVLRPGARLARGGRGKYRIYRNRWQGAQRPVLRSTLMQHYQQRLAPGGAFSFPYRAAENSPLFINDGSPLSMIREALGNDLAAPVKDLSKLTAAIEATRRHEEDILAEARLDIWTRMAILQAEMMTALASAKDETSADEPVRRQSSGSVEPMVIVDVRCLQDPGCLNRGIGRHGQHVLAAVSELFRGEKELVLLTHASLPKLDEELTAFGDSCISTTAGLNKRNVELLVEPSPMTVSPGPLLRLLLDPGVIKVAVVHDFIPGEFPGYYLPTNHLWLMYRTCVAALARYDLFLANSGATAAKIPGFIHRGAPITVTGVANPLQGIGAFDKRPDAESEPFKNYVLVTGAADNRKNLVTAIAAHASYTGISRRRLGLAVIGGHTAEMKAAAQDFARECGLGPDRLKFFTGLDNLQLQSLYERAAVVVVPSFAEGFSMPVVEAIMAGTPVVASDIDAHRELVGAGWWLASPEDPVELGQSVARALADPPELLKLQRAALGERFLSDRVAERIQQALATALSSRVNIEPKGSGPDVKRRPRLAVLTPMPPQQTGIAAYSAHTLKAVARYADIDIYTDRNCQNYDEPGITLHPYSLDPFISNEFDAVISTIGNSHYHIPILEYFLEFGGACIAHDPQMTELYQLMRGPDALASLLSRYSDQPVLPEDLQDFLYCNDLDQLPSIAYDDIASNARPMFVHLQGLSQRILSDTGYESVVLPYVPQLPSVDSITAKAVSAARHSLGWRDDVKHIVTFGIVERHTNAVEVIMDAVAWLRQWGMGCHLHFVGPASSTERSELKKRAQMLGLSEAMHITGWLPDERRQSYLLAADAAVQLRTFTHSPVSGALLDCMSYCLPTVTTENLAKAIQAPPYIYTVPDRFSGLLLAESMAKLLEEPRMDFYTRCEPQLLEWRAARTGDLYAKNLLEALGLEEFTA